MTALTDTIEAALRDAHDQDVSLRRYAEAAARAVDPLIRAAEAAALERAEMAAASFLVGRHGSGAPLRNPYPQQIAAAIRALPRDGSALEAVVAGAVKAERARCAAIIIGAEPAGRRWIKRADVLATLAPAP